MRIVTTGMSAYVFATAAALGVGLALPTFSSAQVRPKTTSKVKAATPIQAPNLNQSVTGALTFKKNLNPLNGYYGPVGSPIDGPPASVTEVDLSGSYAINPTGFTIEITPSTAVPLSAWRDTTTKINTSYFNNAFGNAVTDDEIDCAPIGFSGIAGSGIRYTCNYKTSAHALNIAKTVAVAATVNIRYYANGTNYYASKTLFVGCERATKTTLNFTCSSISM